MAQKINLNASPYYDDFESDKDFYKVLYKPGFPVQARELTQLQSILQNQVENFGDHIFKEGSVVIPGGVGLDTQFNAVKLNSTNFSIDISVYINSFLGKRIKGSESGIEAIVKFIALPDGINVNDVTLYVTYLSADKNSQFNSFSDGESLSCNENVVYGNTTINANTPFASLIAADATAIGSAAFISEGIYFVRGFFVNVSDQTIILDHYSNEPSYKIGLDVEESIINAKQDNSLFDNAKGFTNFAAPGADRLKIKLTLSKRPLEEISDTDFIELMRTDEGKLKKMQVKSDYNKIRDYLAERTFDESGNYSVTPFQMGLFNSLNNGLGNNGLFFSDDTTDENNTPSDDLMCLKLSAGEAYVQGYEIDRISTTILDVEKPRDVGIRSDVGVAYEMGNLLRINVPSSGGAEGLAIQGSVVKLHDGFKSDASRGNIGSARVYSFNLEDAPYEGSKTNWELRLFDIQTNTDIFLNQSVSNTELPKGSFVKGKRSGASGFAVSAGGNAQTITLNETSGSFSIGEQIQVNGVDSPRTVGVVTAHTIQDVRGLSAVGQFNVDTVLETFQMPNGISQVTIKNNVVTSGQRSFNGVTPGSIVRYTRSGFSTETYNKVVSVANDGSSMSITGVGTVTGLFDGGFPSEETVTMFLGAPLVRGSGRLFVPLGDLNVAGVDLTDSKLTITKQVTKSTDGNGDLTINAANDISDIPNVTFDTFDQEKYSVFNTNGVPATITNDTFNYGNGSEIVIRKVDTGSASKTAQVTLSKSRVKSKLKNYTRSQKINVIRSKYDISGSIAAGSQGDGTTQIQDGLTFDARYGLRVQDEEISFNYPDVVKFLAVYESTDINAPTLDRLVFDTTANVNEDSIIGENIVNKDSKVVARIVSKPTTNTIEIVYLTSGKFGVGDTLVFEESKIESDIESITIGLYKNITSSFTLNKGQKNEYYDYSRLVRNKNVPEPSRQLLIVFDHYTVDSDDDGDVFTVRSYDKERYTNDIPSIGNFRATDTFDFRPRVSVYDPSTDTGSPFEFSQRDFSGTAVSRYLTPNENSIVNYEFYLPRIDKIFLSKFGEFVYQKGASSLSPKEPEDIDDAMDLATISLPPYLYNPQDAVIDLVDNRRYTMRDIGDIDQRVANLEETTTLSLLEVNAESLQIQDEEGRNRFKTGFFVDPFNNYDFINLDLSAIQINPERGLLTPFRIRDTLASELKPATGVNLDTLDYGSNFELFDSNVRKTGNVVTLNYEEVEWITQVYATETCNVNPYELPVFIGDVDLNPGEDSWTRSVQLPDQVIRQTGIVRRTVNGGVRAANAGGAGSVVTSTSNTQRTVQNNLVSSSGDDFIRSSNIQVVAEGFVDFVQTFIFFDGQRIFDVVPKLLEITPSLNGTEYGSSGTFKIGETVRALDAQGNITAIFRLCQPDHKHGSYNNPSETYLTDPYSLGVNKISKNYSQSSTVLNVDTRSLSQEAQGQYYGYVSKNSQLVGQESGATAYVKDLKLVTDSFGEVIGSVFIRDPHTQPSPPVKIEAGLKTIKITTSPGNENTEPGQKFGVVFAEGFYTATGTVERFQDTITLTTTVTETTTNFTAPPPPPPPARPPAVPPRRNSSPNRRRRRRNRSRRGRGGGRDPLAQTFTLGGNVEAPSAQDANRDRNGVFVTSVEVYFATVDTVANTPIRMEIRSTTGDARPSTVVIGRSRTLKPKGTDGNGNEIDLIQADPVAASIPTKFTFPDPIYLAPGATYSFVLLAPQSVAYNVWTARHGKAAVNASSISNASPGASVLYTTQYAAGSFFKSQNGALWTEDQSQDMTFKIYKAKFTSTQGSVFFNNPRLNTRNDYIPTLLENPILTLPKTARIGITTNYDVTVNQKLAAGRKISATNDNSTAVIVGTGSSANSVTVLAGGSNYSNVGSATNNVDTFAITGQGSGMKLDLAVTNNAITNASINVAGNGYKVGDVVGIVTSTAANQGRDGTITISSIQGVDTLYLTNMQGDTTSFKNAAQIKYFDELSPGVVTKVAMGSTGEIRDNTVAFTGGINSGNVINVSHFNHAMHSDDNKVELIDIESDVTTTTLTSALLKTESAVISVGSTEQFANFEGVPVGAANTGYVKIGNEIIGYRAIGNGVLNIATVAGNQRGVDNTIVTDHRINSPVRKHEIGGVSIRRFENGSQQVSYSSLSSLDDYYVSFDRSANGTNRTTDGSLTIGGVGYPQLSFTSESFVGGSNVKSSENILYSSLVPLYDIETPIGVAGARTGIDATIRTVTGTSIDGNEKSFEDEGFETVEINRLNVLDSVRLVASKVNEDEYLSDLPSSKSFTTVLNFTTNDENISPMVFINGDSGTEFISHRLNNPIGIDKYAGDNRVNSISRDPHAAIYVSNTVALTKPATSLKVLLSAFRPASSDFRVLYSLIRADSSEIEQAFELFPGFRNITTINDDGFTVVDTSKNDGRPDSFVAPSSSIEFSPQDLKDYQFTADNLPEFVGFTIKIVMLGTDQSRPPRISSLRTIAIK